MKNFLEELFWNRNEEITNRYSHNENLRRATFAFSRYEEKLCKRLKGKNLKLFINSVNAADQMTANIAVENFIDGAKSGTKLMIELLKDD